MKFRLKLLSTYFLCCCISLTYAVFAKDKAPSYLIDGSIKYQIKVTPPDLSRPDILKNYSPEELAGYKTISLMHIRFLNNENNDPLMIRKDKEPDFGKNGKIKPFNKSKGAVDLGMNDVPVLDQGEFGTCVTFAGTAGLDALIGKEDYIDQQCSLELDIIDPDDDPIVDDPLQGNYWNGAYYATQVIYPLKKKGIIQKNKCFGISYPDPYARLQSLSQYTDASDKKSLKKIKVKHYQPLNLRIIKKALKNGHRMVFGTLLGPSVEGYNITIDSSAKTGGLWACQQFSQSSDDNCNGNIAGGHEIVIIGYDDSQQLLKIRNSWNTLVGDDGDFYMTYTYFNYMASLGEQHSFETDGTEVY